jgi:hypothetical protein
MLIASSTTIRSACFSFRRLLLVEAILACLRKPFAVMQPSEKCASRGNLEPQRLGLGTFSSWKGRRAAWASLRTHDVLVGVDKSRDHCRESRPPYKKRS